MNYYNKLIKLFTLSVCCFFISGRPVSAREHKKIDSLFAHMPEELLGTALNKSITVGDYIGLELFLDLNVSPNSRDKSGVTPLVLAIFRKRYHAISILLKHNASLTQKVNGLTPLDVAQKTNNRLAIYMLKMQRLKLEKLK
jgi:ankyrin repeat protein